MAAHPALSMNAPLPPSFSRLAWSNLAAQSAEQLTLTAVPIVAVLMLGAGPGQIGALAMAQTLPFLLLSVPLGVLADRLPRRRLMLISEAIRALTLFALLAMVLSGRLSIWGLGVLGFIGAVGTVGFSVAAPALVPSLVEHSQFARANGRIELARSIAYAAGPAVGGALVAWAGAPSAFVLAAVLSAAAIVFLLRIAEAPHDAAPRRHPLLEIRDGVSFVWQHEYLRPMALTGVAWNIAWFVLQAAYVPYAVRVLGLDARGIGLTLGMYGAGMIVGALFAPRVTAAVAFGRAIQLGPVVSVLASAAMAASLLFPTGALAALSFFLFGAGPIIWTITTTTLRQSITPRRMLGRVSSVFLSANAGARPLGAALGGAAGAAWGEAACLLLSLAGFTLQAAVILFSRVTRLHTLPQTRP